MSRRIDVELTSRRDDGTWTWRAAGARQPKGELDGSLLPETAQVGEVLRVDAEFELDGIVVTAVAGPKGKRRQDPERLEILGSDRSAPGVTTQLASKGKGRGAGKRPKGGRDRGRPEPSAEQRRGPRSEEPIGRPKPKRLKPGRSHRQALIAGLDAEQRPVADLVMRGGVPAVREALQRQASEASAAGLPVVPEDPILDVAEKLAPHLRRAEWQDRAEAALEQVNQVDLRDLRSVVVAAEDAARDDETRTLADSLREALGRRVEEEHRAWIAEMDELLTADRVVRALRVSSRPPKAGAPLPPEISDRLIDATEANLVADTTAERYAIVLDALAYSPIRAQVTPPHVPEDPPAQLSAAVSKLADRIPHIAAAFGVQRSLSRT